ncbi:hypothetical protein D3C85_1369460 [compost metagenome]
MVTLLPLLPLSVAEALLASEAFLESEALEPHAASDNVITPANMPVAIFVILPFMLSPP